MSAFVIVRVRGPAWDDQLPMREQDGWDEHARFMDELADEGFVVLGGPLGDGEQRFMHVCDAPGEAAIRARLDADPWTPEMLELQSVERWEVVLRAP